MFTYSVLHVYPHAGVCKISTRVSFIFGDALHLVFFALLTCQIVCSKQKHPACVGVKMCEAKNEAACIAGIYDQKL